MVLTGSLLLCTGCHDTKGVRAGVTHQQTVRMSQPQAKVHVDISGSFPPSLSGSVYLIMFVDNASRLMRPYGMRKKSEAPDRAKQFIADMGPVECFGTDNAAEFTGAGFVKPCHDRGIQPEFTGAYNARANAVVENATQRAVKAGNAARLEAKRLYPAGDFDALNLGPTFTERGWRLSFGPPAASTVRPRKQTPDGAPRTRPAMAGSRRYRSFGSYSPAGCGSTALIKLTVNQ